ncbi:MAG: YdcH family protein [Gammaproteobacteria bacterium]|nr:YdcH family protein [Gammaproteobacteria bacterium]
MFENHQETVQQLLETDKEFRYFYEQHETLDKQVDEAEAGNLVMDEMQLAEIKKEKLLAKDKLASILQAATRH